MYVARGVAWRSVHNTLVNPAILLPSLIFPLFFLAAFAGGLSKVAEVPNFSYKPGYTAFQFAFVFLQSAAFGGVFTGFAIARDFDSGFARRLLLTAPRRSGIIAGYAAGALVRWLLTGSVITVAALLAGMNVVGNGAELIGIVGLGALIQMPVFVILFLAPVYVPLNLLSGWIHAVARINPATAALEAARGLLAGSPVKVALAFGLLLAGSSLAAVWARRGLASAERAG